MNKIEIKKCHQCQQNKIGQTFSFADEKGQTVTRHYCWECNEQLIAEELTKCKDWEKNKKRIFTEALAKCKKKEKFEEPWTKGFFGNNSDIPYQGLTVVCPKCNENIVDSTPYDDTQHVCKVCDNCGEFYVYRGVGKHIIGKNNNTFIYNCNGKLQSSNQSNNHSISPKDQNKSKKPQEKNKQSVVVFFLGLFVLSGLFLIWIMRKKNKKYGRN